MRSGPREEGTFDAGRPVINRARAYGTVDLSRLPGLQKVAASAGALGVIGFLLPWFRIYGQTRSGLEMILGSPTLTQHATPSLLLMWSTILGLLGLAIVVGLALTLAPALDRDRHPIVRMVASGFAVGVSVLLLLGGFEMGVGYWLAALGSLGLLVGSVWRDPETSASPGAAAS